MQSGIPEYQIAQGEQAGSVVPIGIAGSGNKDAGAELKYRKDPIFLLDLSLGPLCLRPALFNLLPSIRVSMSAAPPPSLFIDAGRIVASPLPPGCIVGVPSQ